MTTGAALCLWSGGTDSRLALHLALDAGLAVTSLLTAFDEEADRSRSHALPASLIAAQTGGLGLRPIALQANWARYEEAYIEALEIACASGIELAGFGDIDLTPHRARKETTCAQAGFKARLLVWDWPRERSVTEVLSRGFKAVWVCVTTQYLPKKFCGRRYGGGAIRDFLLGLDSSGENGKFPAFLTDMSRFRRPVDLDVRPLNRCVRSVEYGGQEFWFAALARA